MNSQLEGFLQVLAVIILLLLSKNAISQNYTLYAIIGNNLAVIDQTTGDATLVAPLSGSFADFSGLTYHVGLNKLLAITDRKTDPRLIEIDIITGAVSVLGSVDIQSPFMDLKLLEAMEYNPSDGILYGAGYELTTTNNWFSSRRLISINPTNGNANFISDISGTCQDEADSFAFSALGTYSLDGCSTSVRLYSIDLITGNASFVGFTGVNSGARFAAHPITGELYGTDASARSFYQISRTTAATNFIGNTHTSSEFGGGTISEFAFVLTSNDCDSDNGILVPIDNN